MTKPAGVPSFLTVRGDKIQGYLLNLDHPRGRSKARFFLSFGFTAARSNVLADALLFHPLDNEASATIRHDGQRHKLVCDGPLRSPDGRNPNVRTVWLLVGDDTAQFVTAIPLKKGEMSAG